MWPWIGVLLVLLLTCFIRYRLLDMPLERDEGEYAYAGQLLQQGIPPYQLAWNMKMPGTYAAYALGMMKFGQDAAGIHSTLMVVNGLTIIFVFMLARKLFGPVAGIAACAAFGILSVSPAVMGMSAHANHLVILFAVLATFLLWKAEEFYRWYVSFFAGLCFGLAFVMKQQGVCFCIFAVVYLIWSGIQHRNLFSTIFLRKMCFLILGMILPLIILYNFMVQTGVYSKFWFWTYTYAASYAKELTPGEGMAKLFDYAEKKWPIYFGYLGFILISLPFVLRDRALRSQIIFAGLFMFFSILGTALDLNFREHYFILLLPALALFFGLALIALQIATDRQSFKTVPPVLCLLILGLSIYQQRLFFFQLPANTVSRIIYTGDTSFADVPAVGDYIRTNSVTSATVAVVGSEPEIYFYAHRHSATGYLYMYPLMEPQPFASQMQKEMISEIETNKPEYLVFVSNPTSWNIRPGSDQTIIKWFSQYSLAGYDLAAVLDESAWDKSVLVSGDALKKYRTLGPNHIAVFKRKSPN